MYIPLGGNRVRKSRWYFNIFVVWALTGLWHGAAPNFLIWGLMFGVILVFEKHYLLKKLEKAHLWNHVYVLLLVMISFVIFNAADMKEAFSYIGGMFGIGNVPLMSRECAYYMRSYGVLIAGSIVGATPLVKNVVSRFTTTAYGKKLMPVLRPIVITGLVIVCTAYLIDSSFNPFLYFRF